MRTVTMKLERPTLAARFWYWRLSEPAPEAVTRHGVADWARLVPYRFRWFHRFFANKFGYFWIPCVLCNRPFGGHESAGSVPNPLKAPHGSVVICSECTIRRNKRRAA